MAPQTKESPLMKLDEQTLAQLPVRAGDKVALHDDHPDHPGKYGLVHEVGFDPDAPGVRLDLRLYDPFDGLVDFEAPTHRVSLAEIQ